MDFAWNTLQSELYDRALAFARENLNDDVRARDAAHRFSREGWRKSGEFGFTGLCLPERYGGMGLDALTTARVVEALGRGCEDGGLAFSVCAHLFACAVPIMDHGPDALRDRLLPGLASGALVGANAITEAEAGSDVHALRTRAVRDGGDYLITGEKTYVTNGPEADVFLVYATVNPAWGYMGITAFVVERDTPGLTVGQPFHKIGLTTSPISTVYFDECRVPEGHRLAQDGQGSLIFRSSMHWERACLFAFYVGAMERQLGRCVEFARTRKQGGKAIGAYQAVSHTLVDMRMRLETSRLLLYRACWLRDQGEEATAEVAMAKIAISEAAVASGLDAIQIHGGSGVMSEYDVERMLRDALPGTLFSGTSEIQRNLIAADMGLK